MASTPIKSASGYRLVSQPLLSSFSLELTSDLWFYEASTSLTVTCSLQQSHLLKGCSPLCLCFTDVDFERLTFCSDHRAILKMARPAQNKGAPFVGISTHTDLVSLLPLSIGMDKAATGVYDPRRANRCVRL